LKKQKKKNLQRKELNKFRLVKKEYITENIFLFFVQINNVYLGDSLELMKDIEKNSIDLILTDAPYFISRKTNFSKGGGDQKKYGSISMEFGDWDEDENMIDFLEVFTEYKRILKTGGTIIFFYDIFKFETIKEIAESVGLKQPRIGFWNKTNTVPINSNVNYLSNCREYFISFCKVKKGVFNSKYDKGVYDYPIVGGKERTIHTTQKPVKLFEDLIKIHSNENDVVLDNFAGSSTTAIACLKTNRNYIMIEKEEIYYNLSLSRIEDYKNKK